jgi:DNA-binding transcriptional MerR regulator
LRADSTPPAASPFEPSAFEGPTAPFATGAVVRVIGVSRRQLQYWAETGLVVPSARTRGGHRRYTFADLVALKAAKQLIDAGVSVQRIRSSLGALKRVLPQVRRPLSELVLVATGDIVLVLREGSAFEAVSGQEWILEVAQFQREIDRVLGSSETVSSKEPEARTAASRREREARSA